MRANLYRTVDIVLKRAFDVALAIIGLAIMAPVMVAISVLVKLDSRGPVLYRGRRTGRYGTPFYIMKFRTMVNDAEKIGGPSTALNDARLTGIGKVLRKYKLDELPQLVNIIKGEMSFVGPRPQVEKYTSLYEGDERKILNVRPGLTDYASVEYIHLDKMLGDEDVDKKYLAVIEPSKNALRLKYVLNRSTWIDLKIFVMTIAKLMRIRSLWNTEN